MTPFTLSTIVGMEDRYNWMRRLRSALQQKSKKPTTLAFSFRTESNNDNNDMEIFQPDFDPIDSQDYLVKYTEIRSVCKEFLEIVKADAMVSNCMSQSALMYLIVNYDQVIISELHQPKYRKTIPVSEEFTVHGR
jgi:hypothetical protein